MVVVFMGPRYQPVQVVPSCQSLPYGIGYDCLSPWVILDLHPFNRIACQGAGSYTLARPYLKQLGLAGSKLTVKRGEVRGGYRQISQSPIIKYSLIRQVDMSTAPCLSTSRSPYHPYPRLCCGIQVNA